MKDYLAELIDSCRVKPGTKIRLKDYDPGLAGDEDIPKEERKEEASRLLKERIEILRERQELFHASDSWSILLIFQGMDTAGKDSIIRHVMTGVNPQGCRVVSFKHPSINELDHNFLWRYTKELPERGQIGVFNRSYFEEVLIVRVHPSIYKSQRIPGKLSGKEVWRSRFDDINNFERHLKRSGTVILKFFLNLSKEEQRDRLLKRIEDPKKHWKFSLSDISEREHWDDYIHAYEEVLTETSTEWAPWYIIPADHKWISRGLVANILTATIESMGLQYPEVSAEKRDRLSKAKKELEAGAT